eukprot:GHVO01010668.1.p1 GENE.GHVO01010668.1~~GHVO01010668.1.p1  ORF type:complete len:236 (-),score=21.18 GHVO01010668.1:45-752(-)
MTTVLRDLQHAPGMPPYTIKDLLHAEQEILITPTAYARLGHDVTHCKSTVTIVDVQDKGSGAIITLNQEIEDTIDQSLLGTCRMSIFIKGIGGFDPKREIRPVKKLVSTLQCDQRENPDIIWTHTIPLSQAALYRLSGDENPLHIDTGFAEELGLSSCPLHGLCTMGHVMVGYFGFNEGPMHDVERIACRFSSMVECGDTLTFKYWAVSCNEFGFDVYNDTSRRLCVSKGYIRTL